MVILVFFMVISVNRRLFRYFGSYSGISVIPVILVNRRTANQLHILHLCTAHKFWSNAVIRPTFSDPFRKMYNPDDGLIGKARMIPFVLTEGTGVMMVTNVSSYDSVFFFYFILLFYLFIFFLLIKTKRNSRTASFCSGSSNWSKN